MAWYGEESRAPLNKPLQQRFGETARGERASRQHMRLPAARVNRSLRLSRRRGPAIDECGSRLNQIF